MIELLCLTLLSALHSFWNWEVGGKSVKSSGKYAQLRNTSPNNVEHVVLYITGSFFQTHLPILIIGIKLTRLKYFNY